MANETDFEMSETIIIPRIEKYKAEIDQSGTNSNSLPVIINTNGK